jgi:hypothetical protein
MGNLQPLTLPDTLDPLVVDYPARLAQPGRREQTLSAWTSRLEAALIQRWFPKLQSQPLKQLNRLLPRTLHCEAR